MRPLNCSSIWRQKFWEYAEHFAQTGFQILSRCRDSDCVTHSIMLPITSSITPRRRYRARMQSGTSHICKRASITPQSCLRRDFNLVQESENIRSCVQSRCSHAAVRLPQQSWLSLTHNDSQAPVIMFRIRYLIRYLKLNSRDSPGTASGAKAYPGDWTAILLQSCQKSN